MKTNVAYLTLTVIFVIVALVLIFFGGCKSMPAAANKPEACACNFGPCQMPPAEKEGFLLMACKVENEHSISCLYFGITGDRRCAIILHTDDCVNYEVSDAKCELMLPKGEQIKWL